MISNETVTWEEDPVFGNYPSDSMHYLGDVNDNISKHYVMVLKVSCSFASKYLKKIVNYSKYFLSLLYPMKI